MGHPPVGELYVVIHLPSGKAVTRFGGAAGKRASARQFCAAINQLIDWRTLSPEKIGGDVQLAGRCHEIAMALTGDTTGARFH